MQTKTRLSRTRMVPAILLAVAMATALVACASYDSGGPPSASSAYPDTARVSAEATAAVRTNQAAPVPDGVNHNSDTGSTEKFTDYGENPWTQTADDRLSTFAIDVDTASYTLMRNDVMERNGLPAPASVRAEEYINYFDYDYAGPADEHPFAVHLESAVSPFANDRQLLRVGVQGYEVPAQERKPANLVFLIDVSGSMSAHDKLPLVKYALQQLLDRLDQRDTLGIVVYAGRESILLQPTRVREKSRILRTLDNLRAGGSTAGAAGIRTAYELAQQRQERGSINRVILCTDGDFNVGMTGDALVRYVADQRERGISLSTFLFGRGNINDAMVEQLANKGNGNHAYIDSPGAAMRAMGEKVVGMLQVIAKDVKIQVEFSSLVKRYRLVGYENRAIRDEDFRNDRVDAGELGAGHSVTALYELEMAAGWNAANADGETSAADAPVATVRLRYKQPEARIDDPATELVRVIPAARIGKPVAEATADFRFATAVAWFAQVMKRSRHVDRDTINDLIRLADGAAGDNADRKEFVRIAARASDMAALYEPINRN